VIGTYGFFATAGEWVNRPATKRTPIDPANDEQMPPLGRWLLEQALRGRHEVVATWVRYLFGAITCPICGGGISVCDAIVASEG
jgi:hypothetical protein